MQTWNHTAVVQPSNPSPLTAGVAVLGALQLIGEAQEGAIALAAGVLEVVPALGLQDRFRNRCWQHAYHSTKRSLEVHTRAVC